MAATAPNNNSNDDDRLSDYQVFVETAQPVFFELLRVMKRRHNDRKARDDDDRISSSNTQRRKRRRDGLLSSLDNNYDTRERQQQRLSELEKQLQKLEGDFVGQHQQSVVDYLSDDLTRLVFCYHEDNDDDDRDGSRVHHLELQLHDFPENML